MIDLAAKPFYLKPEDIEWVNTTLAGMTTEEKAGQLFCVLFKECKPEEFEYVFNILKPGGCMYRVVPTERAIAATQADLAALASLSRQTVNTLLREYDLVLFDTPAANTNADALNVGGAAGYALIVGLANET